jgi:hypothetical protein
MVLLSFAFWLITEVDLGSDYLAGWYLVLILFIIGFSRYGFFSALFLSCFLEYDFFLANEVFCGRADPKCAGLFGGLL